MVARGERRRARQGPCFCSRAHRLASAHNVAPQVGKGPPRARKVPLSPLVLLAELGMQLRGWRR
eukprot:2201294-Lingulodinium_polyedra.AAC.1